MKRFPPPSHRPISTRDKKQKREPSGTPKAYRKILKEREEQEEKKELELTARAKREKLVPIDRSKLNSYGWGSFGVKTLEGKYYLDWPFTCIDCGSRQVWTGRQQKWWYELMGGKIEQIAVRCRDCRLKERARRDQAREVHLVGLEEKKARRMSVKNLKNKRRKRPGTW